MLIHASFYFISSRWLRGNVFVVLHRSLVSTTENDHKYPLRFTFTSTRQDLVRDWLHWWRPLTPYRTANALSLVCFLFCADCWIMFPKALQWQCLSDHMVWWFCFARRVFCWWKLLWKVRLVLLALINQRLLIYFVLSMSGVMKMSVRAMVVKKMWTPP